MDESHHKFLHSPLIIGLLGVIAGAIIVATYHCLVNNCCFIQSRISSARQSEQSTQQVLPTTNNQTRTTSSSSVTTHTNRTTFPSNSIPVNTYTKECREGMCAVCLSDFSDGEAIRVLPDCMHLFHVGCIDMWLNSHANCPLCRSDIIPRQQHVAVERAEPLAYVDFNSISQPPLQHVMLLA